MIKRRSCAIRLRRTGFSLLEVVISTLLVGIVIVISLRTVGAATTSQFANGQRIQAMMIAKDWAEEILTNPYVDPEFEATGIETDVSAGPGQTVPDDIDDYGINSTVTPPVLKNGESLPATQTWTRSVLVQHVDPNDLSVTQSQDDGIARLRIDVKLGTEVLASLTIYATDNEYRRSLGQ